ncbi:hypothetical protein ABW20_dc0101141 [Dactylellina cionopaga]|nr:hypothetical protein ABW20_dc0101141 [Dactylellina cionopaga]
MDKFSKASKAFHRTSKNLRDSTPPASPHRSHFGSLREKKDKDKSSRNNGQDGMKFQISAPVELISSTSMISYTSKALRSPSPTGRTASSIGYSPTSAPSPAIGGRISPMQRANTLNTQKPTYQRHHQQPPSPVSSSGDSIKSPLSPEVGLAILDVMTPPATPPPDHIPNRSRSSSIGKTAAMNIITTRQSGHIQRIKSTSSLSSSVSNGSSHESYKVDHDTEPLPSPDPRRITTTFGQSSSSYKGGPSSLSGARSSHTSSNSGSSYAGLSLGPLSPSVSSAANSPSMPPPPPRVSARRSASNPNMKTGPKRNISGKSNPFAHELAQVSELAEDMGLDLVDNDVMVRKGLMEFSAKDYLAVIRDVVLFPLDFEEEVKPVLRHRPSQQQQRREREREVENMPIAPIVPARRKPTMPPPSVERHPSVTQMRMHAPKPVVAQSVEVGGWI